MGLKDLAPLKNLGQNFLRDQNIIRKIVSEIAPQKNDFILEIGPGEGAITELLLSMTDNYLGVELDSRAVELLPKKFQNITLIQDDFLQIDLQKLYEANGKKKIRVVGNIPYHITSPILFKLIENNEIIEDAVLMMQLEVAQRLVADMKTKSYGILSVIHSIYSDIDLCFKISPQVFFPKPKVYSALVHLHYRKKDEGVSDKPLFNKVVKAAFNYRRKTLRNALSLGPFSAINFDDAGIDLNLRAEALTTSDYIQLTNYVKSIKTK